MRVSDLKLKFVSLPEWLCQALFHSYQTSQKWVGKRSPLLLKLVSFLPRKVEMEIIIFTSFFFPSKHTYSYPFPLKHYFIITPQFLIRCLFFFIQFEML